MNAFQKLDDWLCENVWTLPKSKRAELGDVLRAARNEARVRDAIAMKAVSCSIETVPAQEALEKATR